MVILPGVTRCQLKDFVADLYIRHRQKIKFTVKEEIIEDLSDNEHIEIDIQIRILISRTKTLMISMMTTKKMRTMTILSPTTMGT